MIGDWDDSRPHDPERRDEWDRYTRAFPGPCVCSHPESLHYRDRKDRPTCGVSVCGCDGFREGGAA